MRRALIIAVAASLATTPARAGWQYTKWGMTKEQVITASRGAAQMATKPCRGDPPGVAEPFYLTGTYTTGEFTFDACFSGNSEKGLQNVTLNLQNGKILSGTTLRQALQAKYGNPITEMKDMFVGHTAQWRDGDTKVTLFNIVRGEKYLVAIVYSPDESGGL